MAALVDALARKTECWRKGNIILWMRLWRSLSILTDSKSGVRCRWVKQAAFTVMVHIVGHLEVYAPIDCVLWWTNHDLMFR